MGDWWYRNITEPGKLPLLLALGSLVVTFAITRTITRMIRAGRGPFHDISPGGVHIHHVVPGAVLTVVGGFGAVASGSHGFGAGFSAVAFGIGTGLMLDEFALILHLDDVYWTDRGRKSVEAVLLATALAGMLLIGLLPFGVNSSSPAERNDRGTALATVAVNFLLALIALTKGKPRLAVFGVLIPFVALIAAIRLARPGSVWAHRLYARRPHTRARAEKRAARHDARWSERGTRLQNLLGGTPDH